MKKNMDTTTKIAEALKKGVSGKSEVKEGVNLIDLAKNMAKRKVDNLKKESN